MKVVATLCSSALAQGAMLLEAMLVTQDPPDTDASTSMLVSFAPDPMGRDKADGIFVL